MENINILQDITEPEYVFTNITNNNNETTDDFDVDYDGKINFLKTF